MLCQTRARAQARASAGSASPDAAPACCSATKRRRTTLSSCAVLREMRPSSEILRSRWGDPARTWRSSGALAPPRRILAASLSGKGSKAPLDAATRSITISSGLSGAAGGCSSADCTARIRLDCSASAAVGAGRNRASASSASCMRRCAAAACSAGWRTSRTTSEARSSDSCFPCFSAEPSPKRENVAPKDTAGNLPADAAAPSRTAWPSDRLCISRNIEPLPLTGCRRIDFGPSSSSTSTRARSVSEPPLRARLPARSKRPAKQLRRCAPATAEPRGSPRTSSAHCWASSQACSSGEIVSSTTSACLPAFLASSAAPTIAYSAGRRPACRSGTANLTGISSSLSRGSWLAPPHSVGGSVQNQKASSNC
mmetsp:Transcript_125844/g.355841  ORF Transcript_125844/g.355841 Transcript_125844/m.355841 type:complete len:369 (+) Transcript_125844:71-1177(+)